MRGEPVQLTSAKERLKLRFDPIVRCAAATHARPLSVRTHELGTPIRAIQLRIDLFELSRSSTISSPIAWGVMLALAASVDTLVPQFTSI